MQNIIVDLEATCWPEGNAPDRMEIIEIGAVKMDAATGEILSEYCEFVRPVREPVLSEFCTQLTSIGQDVVDAAETFDVVFPRFLEWIGPDPFRLCSWGGYDLKQFRIECGRHGLPLPANFENHINIKKEFARMRRVHPMGLSGAMKLLQIPFEGTHHRGIDDARNIAKIARLVFAQLESSEGSA